MIVTIGTSIEAGVGVGTGESWPSRLAVRRGMPVVDRSLGGGAYTRENSEGDTIRKHVDAAIAEFPPGVMILGGPVNDLVTLSDVGPLRWAVHYADEAATAAGWHVLAQAILPFNDGGVPFPTGWWPNLEERRTAYNDWAALHFTGRWVDPSGWLTETTTARGDNRWFTDGLHPRSITHALIAEAFPLDRLEVS